MAKEHAPRSLRFIVLLLVSANFVFFTCVFYAVFHSGLPGMLLQSETLHQTEQLEVVGKIFASAQDRLYSMTADTALWPEAVDYAEGRNPDFIAKNWPDAPQPAVYRFNLFLIKDKDGNDLHAEFYDYLEHKPLPVPRGFSDFLRPVVRSLLERHRSPQDPALSLKEWGAGGIAFFDGVAYSFAIMPVQASRGAEKPSGVVIMGVILNNGYFRDLTHFDSSTFEILSLAENIPAGGDVRRESGGIISASMTLQDIESRPVLLRMSDRRPIYEEGKKVLNRTALLLVGVMALFAVAIYQLTRRRILRPIERLSVDMAELGSAQAIDATKYSGSREFAALCVSINDMRHRLSRSRDSISVLQHILNGMDAYLYVTDPQTDEILFINDKMREHYGIEGKGVGRICWQALQSGFTQRCGFCPNFTLEKNPDEVVIWEEHSTLTGRWYHNTDRLIDWPDGRKVHLQHSVDVTDIKRAEESLKQRLDQQELMAAMAQSFISSADMDSLITDALRMAGEFMNLGRILLGALSHGGKAIRFDYVWHNKERGVGPLSADTFFFPEGGGMLADLTARREPFLAYEDISGVEYLENPRKQGVKALIAAPVFIEGKPWGMLVFEETEHTRAWSGSDKQLITLIGSVISGAIERNATEEKLLRMSSIVNSSPQYISYVSPEGAFEYLNPGALRMTGYSEEELRAGGMPLIFNPATYADIMENTLPRTLREGRAEFELPLRRKDGTVRILNFSVFTTDSKKIGIGAIASDITEKRQLEKDLIAAKDQAEQSSRAKGEFLSRMSHEMRTPLNAIIGMTSIAQGSQETTKKDYCLEKIDSASKHLLGVINDILDMSKIEANKFELSPTEFRLEKLLLRVVNVINFRVEEKSQTLIVHIDPNIPYTVVADEQRLAQVVANLLSNAVKFTPEKGSITLNARVLEEQDDTCMLQISITDTGIGITEEQRSRLFHSFEQADGGIARKFGGTGLGLAISKSIVELMGGEIHAEPAEGQGAIFSFTFMVKKGTNRRTYLLSPGVHWSNLRVLVVDDAPEVREYFSELAKTVGFACETAADGFEAVALLDAAQNAPYNLAFVDWQMPGMDGIELTRRIKRRFGSSSVVIMISATQWGDIEKDAKAAGVDGFLPKPLFSSLIVDCINGCMGPEQCSLPAEHHAPADDGIFAGYRVLLAEDNDINREIVISLLEHTKVIVDCAENGQQAFDMFRNTPSMYDLIFMDIHMPEVDGYEATRRIRGLEQPEAKAVPIVAMTANVFREDVERCLAAGMTDHIGKPINIEELIAKMKQYLVLRV